MAILQVVSLALVCVAVQAALPAGGPNSFWAGQHAGGEGAHPIWSAIKEKLGSLGLASRNGSLHFGGPHAWHSGRPMFFNHHGQHRPGQQGPGGPGGPQGPQGPDSQQGPTNEQGPPEAGPDAADNSDPASPPAQAPANAGPDHGPQHRPGQHGPGGPQGPHGPHGPEGRPNNQQGPPAAGPDAADNADPAEYDGPASPSAQTPSSAASPPFKPEHPSGFGPAFIKHINSPEEAGAKPVASEKHHRWAKKSTAAPPTSAAPAPAPVAKSSAAPSTGSSGKGSPLNICTWNIFRFGQSKFAAEPMATFKKDYGKDKLEMIAEQVKNADIIAIQEYFDTTETHDVMNVVTDYLNKTTGSKWGMSVGPRVGRGSKEQYVFLYRTELASVMKEAVAPEPVESKDPYSREPWFAQFKITKPGFSMPTLTLGTIHTEPDYAVREMNAMDVYTWPWAESTFNTKEVMMLGDYNADCQYVRKSDWETVTLFTKKEYTWFIPTGTDTAAMSSECTFDRAVTRSPKIQASFVPGSLRVLDFVSQYKIPVATARQLSDHFPVCMQFK